MKCARRLAGAQRPAPSAGSPPRPDPRSGRHRARFSLLLPALALLLGALSPFAAAPAQAQTVTLVSNYGQTAGASLGANGYVNAQAFTTGAAANGYTLHSIEAVIEENGSQPLNAARRAQVRAELWSATAGGAPNARVAALTVPTGFTAGTVAFAAPSGTTLDASTTYFFLLYTTGTFSLRIDYVTATGQTGESGWGIGDARHWRSGQTPGAGSWSQTNNEALRITVKGTAAPVVTVSDLRVTPGNQRLSVRWTAPAGWRAVGYDVEYRRSGHSHWTRHGSFRLGEAAWRATTRVISVFGGDNAWEVRVRPRVYRGRNILAGNWVTWPEGADAPPTVSLSVSPNPVPEGQSVQVTATLSRAHSGRVGILVTKENISAEETDFDLTVGNRLSIPAGNLSSTANLGTANHDDDSDDETIRINVIVSVSRGGVSDPPPLTLTIRDDEYIPPPGNLRVTPGNQSLTVRWTAPVTGAGQRVVGYDVQYRRSDGGWISHGSFTPGLSTNTQTSRVINTGGIPPAHIQVQVRARVLAGTGTVAGAWATSPEVTSDASLSGLELGR